MMKPIAVPPTPAASADTSAAASAEDPAGEQAVIAKAAAVSPATARSRGVMCRMVFLSGCRAGSGASPPLQLQLSGIDEGMRRVVLSGPAPFGARLSVGRSRTLV